MNNYLKNWLKKNGHTIAQVSREIKVTRQLVSAYLNGTKDSLDIEIKVREWVWPKVSPEDRSDFLLKVHHLSKDYQKR